MNNPLTINVHIDLGVTEELKNLLLSLTGSKKEGQNVEIIMPADPNVEEYVKLIKERKAKAEGVEPVKVEEEPEAEEAPAVAEAPAEEPKAEAREFTEEDVRAAMDRARRRIEGEDYKEKTDSEGHKKWHRQLTSWFKNNASIYGAEKPSALESSDKREAFIKDCDALVVEDDKLVIPLPY